MSGAVIDLFSCGGGASAGFAGAFGFHLAAAVDLEVAKPSGKNAGETGCNFVYEANLWLKPLNADLMQLEPLELMSRADIKGGETAVLISCAPCTDFSRANPTNHLSDGSRNTLVGRSGYHANAIRPRFFVMENARELLTGNHPIHWRNLRDQLTAAGMNVAATVHKLSRFGLPQVRERALVLAVRGSTVRSLEDLWEGWAVSPDALTVRTALGRLYDWKGGVRTSDTDGDAFPGMNPDVAARVTATPKDGGSWIDLGNAGRFDLMTADCIRRYRARDFGSHPDVYGRMAWDRSAPTIKRECAHTGNGRYLHPEENRLLTVREMATLQGFPFDYRFPLSSVANRYRVIGDAVPPMIARQLAACASWNLTGRKPDPSEWIMPGTTLRLADLRRVSGRPIAVSPAKWLERVSKFDSIKEVLPM